MPRGKAPTFDSQRAAILEAAAILFAEKGFASASMADLAEACGVSKALLYHYYRDKAHLLFDTADSYLDTLIAIVAEVRERRLAPMEHFKALVARLMQEYEHAQAQHMVLVQDVKFLGAKEHARIIAKERQVVDAVAQAIAALKPRFRKKAMRVPLAMILFGMINWTFTWLRPDGSLSYDDMSEVVAEIFLGGVAMTQRS
ncbi:MAG TPA: TetR/AcrR family transcriptional regulator [Burkholderiales bacterium]|nr:TetR/AcrR family transcriptional regulator [Burkholderiales bacterium]